MDMIQKSRWQFAIALLIVLVSSGSAFADENPIRVGVLTTLTGNWAAVGENVTRGITLAIEEINSKGGVQGRKIEFEIQDTDEELSGAKILSAYRYLRTKGYQLFIGPTGVPGSESLGPVAAKDSVVIITSAALTHFQRFGSNLFNVIGDSEKTSRAAARWSYKNKARTASVLRSDQPWEFSQGGFFADEFKKIGGKVVSIHDSPADEKEFRIQSLKIARENPDVVFLATFNQIAYAAKSLDKFKVGSTKTCALLDDAHLKAAQNTLEDASFFLFQGPDDDFRERYKTRFAAEAGYASDYSFDAIHALAAAIALAESDEPVKVQEALTSVEFRSSRGNLLRFGKDRFVDRQIQRYQVVDNAIVERPSDGV